MTGRVLASFERVCDLVTDDGEVVALVWGGIGNGPLNAVLDGRPGAALPAGIRFAWRERLLTVGDVTFDLPMLSCGTRDRIGMCCGRGGCRFSPRQISPGVQSPG